jgi:hypothetical protein
MLTRDEILALDDITVKKITVPDTIPVWGGKSLYIKQLTRGQQDVYNKRQFSGMTIKQDGARKNGNGHKPNEAQELIGMASIYGHDAWLCVRGICDETGKTLFTDADLDRLNAKSGEAIGWIALEIVKFSNMANDSKVVTGEMTAAEALSDEIKN